jgi:hypothetical protein
LVSGIELFAMIAELLKPAEILYVDLNPKAVKDCYACII